MEITEVRVALREQAAIASVGEGRSGSAPVSTRGGPGTPRQAHEAGRGPPRQWQEAGRGETRLKAYATLTFDCCFVVRNIKVIEGRHGLFVAMPSHKPKLACERCHFKNDFGGRFCSQCGAALSRAPSSPAPVGESGLTEAQAHRDIAHPITAEFRQYLQQKVLEAYEAERAKVGGGSARNSGAPDESLDS